MFNVGTGELVLILVLALIVLGPDKLPSAARQAGRYLAELRRISTGFQNEFRRAVDTAMEDAELSDFKLPDLSDMGLGSGSFRLPDRFEKDGPVLPEVPEQEPPVVPLDKTPAAEPGAPSAHVDVDGPSSSFS